MKKICIALLIFSTGLWAQNVDFTRSAMAYGTFATYTSATSLGLGNSGIAGHDAALAGSLNPALAAGTDATLALHAGMAINLHEEDRAYPYYDTFAGFTDYGSYLYNKNWYNAFYGTVQAAVAVPVVGKLVLSSGYLPFIDYAYDYHEEVGYPGTTPEYKKDEILGRNIIKNEGSLAQIPMGIALLPVKNLAVGLQMALLTGDLNNTVRNTPRAELFSEEEYDAIYMVQKSKNSLRSMPLVTSLGATYDVNAQLRLGLQSRLPFTLQYKDKVSGNALADTTINYDLDYPLQLGVGLEYRFTNVLQARFVLDFVYDFWSQFDDSRQADLHYQDTYAVRLGVEHMFFNRVPLRAGFSYESLKESRDFSRTLLTIGSGLHIRDLEMNFALGFTSLQYYQTDMFSDAIYGQLDRGSELDRVRTNDFFGRIDFNYALSFGK